MCGITYFHCITLKKKPLQLSCCCLTICLKKIANTQNWRICVICVFFFSTKFLHPRLSVQIWLKLALRYSTWSALSSLYKCWMNFGMKYILHIYWMEKIVGNINIYIWNVTGVLIRLKITDRHLHNHFDFWCVDKLTKKKLIIFKQKTIFRFYNNCIYLCPCVIKID